MKAGLKVVATFTLFCFMTTQCVSASPGAGIEMTGGRELPSFLSLDIPVELATIDELYEAPNQASPQFILHIQDAHANYEAQTKIKQLLAYLNKQYSINTVFVEGASEKLDADYIRLFQDEPSNLKLADTLAKQGELSGTELYLLEAGKNFEALGIEDASLYKENYEALKTLFGASGDADRFFKGFDSRLEQVSSKVFSSEVRELIVDWRNFEKGRREFLPYVKDLVKKAKTVLQEDLESLFAQVAWPQITRLLVIQMMEKDLNKPQALAERDALVKFLRDKKVSNTLIDSITRFQEGNISVGRPAPGKNPKEVMPRYLLEQLVAEAGPKGFKFSDYPHFSLYAGYVVLKGELDAKVLFDEVEYLFTKMLDASVQEASQKKLLELYRDGELLRKLLYLELNRAAWRKVQERQSVLAIDSMVARLKECVQGAEQGVRSTEYGAKNTVKNSSTSTTPYASRRTSNTVEAVGDVMSPEYSKRMTELTATGFKFYNFACQREEVFYKQMRTAMAERKIRKAVVITGGFHTSGLSDLFRENETSYGIVTPRLSEKSDEKLYKTSMLQSRDYPFSVSYIPPGSNEISLRALAAMGVDGAKRIAAKFLAFMDVANLAIPEAVASFNLSPCAVRSEIRLVESGKTDDKGRAEIRIVFRTPEVEMPTNIKVGGLNIQAGPITSAAMPNIVPVTIARSEARFTREELQLERKALEAASLRPGYLEDSSKLDRYLTPFAVGMNFLALSFVWPAFIDVALMYGIVLLVRELKKTLFNEGQKIGKEQGGPSRGVPVPAEVPASKRSEAREQLKLDLRTTDEVRADELRVRRKELNAQIERIKVELMIPRGIERKFDDMRSTLRRPLTKEEVDEDNTNSQRLELLESELKTAEMELKAVEAELAKLPPARSEVREGKNQEQINRFINERPSQTGGMYPVVGLDGETFITINFVEALKALKGFNKNDLITVPGLIEEHIEWRDGSLRLTPGAEKLAFSKEAFSAYVDSSRKLAAQEFADRHPAGIGTFFVSRGRDAIVEITYDEAVRDLTGGLIVWRESRLDLEGQPQGDYTAHITNVRQRTSLPELRKENMERFTKENSILGTTYLFSVVKQFKGTEFKPTLVEDTDPEKDFSISSKEAEQSIRDGWIVYRGRVLGQAVLELVSTDESGFKKYIESRRKIASGRSEVRGLTAKQQAAIDRVKENFGPAVARYTKMAMLYFARTEDLEFTKVEEKYIAEIYEEWEKLTTDFPRIENDWELLELAKTAAVRVLSLDGGLGEKLGRANWKAWLLSRGLLSFEEVQWEVRAGLRVVKLGAKGTDMGYLVRTHDGKIRYVSISEAKLLQLYHQGRVHRFGELSFRPLVNGASEGSYRTLLDRDNLLGIQFKSGKLMNYRELLKSVGVEIEEFQMQPKVPGLREEPDADGRKRMMPAAEGEYSQEGGHGWFGALIADPDSYIPRTDGKSDILVFTNGDNEISSNIVPEMVGDLIANDRAIGNQVTPATRVDRKGGKYILKLLEFFNMRKWIPGQRELAAAKELGADAEDAFYKAGQPDGESLFGASSVGRQPFNTNNFYINMGRLIPFLADLKRTMGEDEYLAQVVSPNFMRKDPKQGSDGRMYYPIDSAIGNVFHNINEFVMRKHLAAEAHQKNGVRLLPDEEAILAVLNKHGMKEVIHYYNVSRSKFTPQKNPWDALMQMAGKYHRLDLDSANLVETKGALVPPEVVILDAAGNSQDSGKGYYSEFLNMLNTFVTTDTVRTVFESPFDIRALDKLEIYGNLAVRDAIFIGTVKITRQGKVGDVYDLGAKIRGDRELRKELGLKRDGPLVLRNVEITISEGGEVSIIPFQARSEVRGMPVEVIDAAGVQNLVGRIQGDLAKVTGLKPTVEAKGPTLKFTMPNQYGVVVVSNPVGVQVQITNSNFAITHWDSARSEIRTDTVPFVLPFKVPNDRPQITLDEYRAMVTISEIIPEDQVLTLKETSFAVLRDMGFDIKDFKARPELAVAVAVTYGVVSIEKNLLAVAPLLGQMASLIDARGRKGVVKALQQAVPEGTKIPITLEEGNVVMILDRLSDFEAFMTAIKFVRLLHPRVIPYVFVRDPSVKVDALLASINRWEKGLNLQGLAHIEVAKDKKPSAQQKQLSGFLKGVQHRGYVVLRADLALDELTFGNVPQIQVLPAIWDKSVNMPIVMDITSRAAQVDAEALDKQAADLGLFGKGRQFMINADSILMLQNLQVLYAAFQSIQAAA
ncbi:MAG: hypothetical protein ABH891_03730 [Candidatus Omnitrophota bacterium]